MQCSPQSTTPHRFSDLIGNVAEYVTDQPIPANQWPAPSKSITAAKSFVESHAQSFRVIGGSALSAPELSTTEPLTLDNAASDRGYSDTGFRLAFTAAEIPFKDRAMALAARIQYLPGKPATP
jgi:formylglycine-generating enzyme required for sulfatase activity